MDNVQEYNICTNLPSSYLQVRSSALNFPLAGNHNIHRLENPKFKISKNCIHRQTRSYVMYVIIFILYSYGRSNEIRSWPY
jgi:hypothetical protein